VRLSYYAGRECFTHVDPFEDTERTLQGSPEVWAQQGFTHVDPFEDTESGFTNDHLPNPPRVSPTSIRSRILKGRCLGERCSAGNGFTHVDPFEDTESPLRHGLETVADGVSPTSIRSRILKGPYLPFLA